MVNRTRAWWMFLAGIGLLVGVARGETASWQAEYTRLVENADDAAIEAHLDKWLAALPDDAEAYVAKANHFHDRFTRERALQLPPPAAARSMQTALQTLRTAVSRFPLRLDVRCGLIFLLQEAGDYAGQYQVVAAMLEFQRTRGAEWQWKNGGPLPAPLDTFMPDTLQGYIRFYFEAGTPAAEADGMRLARLFLRHYPRNKMALSDVGLFHSLRGDQQRAVVYLKKAVQLAPDDVVLWMNLGRCHRKLKNFTAARSCYLEALAQGKPDYLMRDARDALAELNAEEEKR